MGSILEPEVTKGRSQVELLEMQLNATEALLERPEVQTVIRKHWRSIEPYKSNPRLAVPQEVPAEVYTKLLSIVTISHPHLRVNRG